MRPVMAIDDVLSALPRQCARDIRKQLPMTDRTVQVDQQSRRGRSVQRCPECVGHLTGEIQRARVPAAVAVEQRLAAREERGARARDLAPTVFATDDELTTAYRRQRSCSGHIAQGCHRAPVYFLVSTVLSLETAEPVPPPLVEPDPGFPPEPTVPEAPPTMPVSDPFEVTSVPCPGTAAGALDVVGELDEGLGYSPLLAGGGGTGDLRSWQPASVTTATAATAASDFSL